MVDVKIGCLSIIDIYSGGGIKMVKGRIISGANASHRQNCKAGNCKPGNGKSEFGLPFFE
jgi:hypothetical protein